MPYQWDDKIRSALIDINSGIKQNDQEESRGQMVPTSCCAFLFGINTCSKGTNGQLALIEPYPPGIHAVEFTANMRTCLFSLPYGDQVRSAPFLYQKIKVSSHDSRFF